MTAWPDDRLVRQCCAGDPNAWSALIDKYKNLIFSVPIKFGLSPEEASDIFQAVCLDVLLGLPTLREPQALPKWLIQVAYHKCLRWKRDQLPAGVADPISPELMAADPGGRIEDVFYQGQREQSVRDALQELSPRCHQMVTMLFFEHPARAYDEIAKQLGIATGSVGFIRGRCLKKLRRLLEEKGFV